MKTGERWRIAYWDDNQEAVLIFDPKHEDYWTTFIPKIELYPNNRKDFFYHFIYNI